MRRARFTTLIGLNFVSLGLMGAIALESASISHNLKGVNYSIQAIDHTMRATLERFENGDSLEYYLERSQENLL